MKTKTCSKCPYYSFGLRRCKNGHVNPRSYNQTKEVMSLMGYDYVCCYNRYKMRVVRLEMGGLNFRGAIA